jgi:hypothetical protein
VGYLGGGPGSGGGGGVCVEGRYNALKAAVVYTVSGWVWRGDVSGYLGAGAEVEGKGRLCGGCGPKCFLTTTASTYTTSITCSNRGWRQQGRGSVV